MKSQIRPALGRIEHGVASHRIRVERKQLTDQRPNVMHSAVAGALIKESTRQVQYLEHDSCRRVALLNREIGLWLASLLNQPGNLRFGQVDPVIWLAAALFLA